MNKRLRFLTLLITCAVLSACGAAITEPDMDDEPADVIVCGDHEIIERDEGGVADCVCEEGFSRDGDACVEPDAPEPDEEPDEELPRSLPLTCWLPHGSFCDPRAPTQCDLDAGETCDIASDTSGAIHIACLPGPNTQKLGESCDAATGQYCEQGTRCIDGACRSFCCDSSECDTGTFCEPLSEQVGSLGVCVDGQEPEPMCAAPGGSCQVASDCCSRECHSGHCH